MPTAKNKPAGGRKERRVQRRCHSLKTWPDFFYAVEIGTKTFEVRKNDRDFQQGDILTLKEYQPPLPGYEHVPGFYTGSSLRCEVSYVLKGPGFGIEEGFCVLGFRRVDVQKAHLEMLLKQAEKYLMAHHESSLCTWQGDCPVCSRQGKESYPDNIFGRIERALKPSR